MHPDALAAARRAAAWLADPSTVILDTETTDLNGYLVQIAVIDAAGETLLDTLVDPLSPISAAAARVHGLTEATLKGAPPYRAIHERLTALLRGRRVVIYNAQFDTGILHSEVRRLAEKEHWFEPTTTMRRLATEAAAAWARGMTWECAMLAYSAYVGEPGRYGDYRWQRLPGGDHTALGDCRATLAVLREMAASVAVTKEA